MAWCLYDNNQDGMTVKFIAAFKSKYEADRYFI